MVTGSLLLTVAHDGLVVLNDLRKSCHSRPVWSWVIDLTTGLMVLVSVSALVPLFYVRRRRRPGLVLAVLAWRFAP